MSSRPLPLDLSRTGYSYVERHNATLLALLERHVLGSRPRGRILDVGCGAGANGRAIRARHPDAFLAGVEPDRGAARLASETYDEVCADKVEVWLERESAAAPFDAVVLSDVLEHIVDPISFMRSLASASSLRDATWIVSVPNYGVWYNRLNALFGRFEYAWSGLYDRTHVRFFTRRSIRRLLEYSGFRVVDEGCTPSFVQSLAPVLRRFFEKDVERGEHLTLTASPAYRVYSGAVEPAETAICGLWPELLGFQIVSVAKLR
jgi:2-polyprenyl-3-methyl-5-hydroxy-6-metoxy-1,4-benzoquinol methylase